jgi:hypothetical protein
MAASAVNSTACVARLPIAKLDKGRAAIDMATIPRAGA